MNNSGSVTILILLVMFLLMVLFLSISFYFKIAIRKVYFDDNNNKILLSLRQKAETIVRMLLNDPSPDSDSIVDPVWNEVKNLKNGRIKVSLSDVSSFLGINWIRKEFLDRLGFINPGITAKDFQQYREDKGLHLNILRGYGNLINKDALEKYFTSYSYFNINISDEFVLRDMFLIRTSDIYASDRFHKEIQEMRIKKQIIEEIDLKDFIGTNYFDNVFPILNAEPVINIHFVNKRILGILFDYFNVPQKKKEIIIETRKKKELDRSDLESYIGNIYSKTLLHHYLGTITWFWKIEVSFNNKRLEWIIARVPLKNISNKHNFRLIEENIYE